MNIYQDAANNAKEHQTLEFSERRLWAAVLLQAVEDRNSTNMRHRKDAEKFFFEMPEDFARVCRGAGMSPSGVLARIKCMKEKMPQRPAYRFLHAA